MASQFTIIIAHLIPDSSIDHETIRFDLQVSLTARRIVKVLKFKQLISDECARDDRYGKSLTVKG